MRLGEFLGRKPQMLAIGPGPGPKNVLVLMPDGSKTVVPYMVWKHKLSAGKRSHTHSLMKGRSGAESKARARS